MPSADATTRFSDRVRNYVLYRPGYPSAVLDVLRQETGLAPSHAIADVGSGTGISARLFLDAGNTVHAVEPNADMRAAAEAALGGDPRFHSVAGAAEATTLPDASVDYVVAAQAYHWFDPPAVRREWLRILRPGGWMVLLWNARRTDTTPFLRGYEALLHAHGTDYASVNHENVTPERIAQALGADFGRRDVPSEQVFDYEGLKGRLLSSSYAPNEGHPGHKPMLEALERLFREHAENGNVRFEYDTQIYWGRG
ncbi:class I SAM-dependent methyltransferase [Longimicrobium sp.]|uniref:class I SAM-dependent methyltransferase n=1 Tax=Longimicrobium sp. TaxID=2029185 RepID=UPI002E34B04A|nr:class I SAM-dependent methyltransferase [Longimicrobium sp.]HEX6040263.1 class I SAM-dependent methyltransferase [Longimicrobium sp.]